MKATYVDHMGSDLSVVNAARVSFDKKHDKFEEARDARLIRYLAKHNHWTPFGHTSITVHCKAPIFVARQLGKHQTGLVWNEVSRRYVDSEPEFFVPDSWRLRAKDKKQGSSEETIEEFWFSNGVEGWKTEIDNCVYSDIESSLCLYDSLLDAGVAPEQARMVLPQSTYTEWYWTGSLAAFARVCNLRLAPDTQKETRDIAEDISGIMRELYPVSWEALVDSA
jgi:thymidylate synthase (FAD)